MLISLLLLTTTRAEAFCGTYVGTAGADLHSAASEVAIVRDGTRTTLTLANDYEGPLSEFAVVIPVPVVLGEQDVRVVDPEVFGRLGLYSGPRLVSYTCDELYPDAARTDRPADSIGCSLGCSKYFLYAESGDDYGTVVEAQFIVGEYEVVVLSAAESEGLLQWLGDNGYAVPSTTADLLQEYLDAGSYFFAAKVFLDRVPDGQDKLSPLQFSYDSDVFSLPIRLGTANSAGAQDLVIYAVSSLEQGRIGVANYEERTIEEACLVREPDAFASFYEAAFTDAVRDDAAHWVAEYGWSITSTQIKCDPCPPGVNPAQPVPASDVYTLGYGAGGGSLDTGSWWGAVPDFYFTRLHLRYTPEQATQDLTLYASGITDNTQQRYVRYEPYLEVEFPVCGDGWVADPGSCADVDAKYRHRVRSVHGGGCSASPVAAATGPWALFLGLALFFRRRT